MAQLLVYLITVTLCDQGQPTSPKAIWAISPVNGHLFEVLHQQEVGLGLWDKGSIRLEVRAPCRPEPGFRREPGLGKRGPRCWGPLMSPSF